MEAAMLGIKLGPEIEQRFERFVRRRGQRKSDVGRAAIVEYMDRHDIDDAEFRRQLAVLAAFERTDPVARAELEEMEELAWRMARPDD
jgi:predicted transcriptional regulator